MQKNPFSFETHQSGRTGNLLHQKTAIRRTFRMQQWRFLTPHLEMEFPQVIVRDHIYSHNIELATEEGGDLGRTESFIL